MTVPEVAPESTQAEQDLPRMTMTESLSHMTRRRFIAASGGLAAMLAARQAPAVLGPVSPNEVLSLGFIGIGGRGVMMLKTLGYFDEATTREFPRPLPRLESVRVTAVCDTFQDHLDAGVQMVKAQGGEAQPYVDYREMLEKEKLDAVVIAAPDHHHARATIAAMEAGCDVYVEKCMTNTLDELKLLRETMQRTGRILQVGHQGRQDAIHLAAHNVVKRGTLGKVALVQTFLSRGGPAQAWIRPISHVNPPGLDVVHWDLFLGDLPRREYDARRYFEWRRFWDYSTGIAGDLMSHELDTVHHVIELGVPKSAVASGGVYFWKDGRETPDTWSVVLEYPDRELSISYGANIHNNYDSRASIFLGSEATMELDWECRVYPDSGSGKYAKDLQSGKLDHTKAMIKVGKQAGELVGSAATSTSWLDNEGLLLTTRDGKLQDTSRLHHENFYKCMRDRTEPDASFQRCYATTVATLLCVAAYREGKKAYWDAEKEQVVF